VPPSPPNLRLQMAAICEGLRQEVAGELRVTTLFPGYPATNFADHVRDEGLRFQLASGAAIAMPPDAVAAAVAFAIDQPKGVNIGEIVLRPTAQG
jgi:NADP-dependent 3-hydroxy acid dehydrogenase YdfG